MSNYARKPPTGITRTNVTVPNGSFSAVQAIPAGTMSAWMTFNVAPGTLTVRYAQGPALLEILNASGAGEVERWDLFPSGESQYPLNAALDVEFQGTVGGITATLHTRQEPRA